MSKRGRSAAREQQQAAPPPPAPAPSAADKAKLVEGFNRIIECRDQVERNKQQNKELNKAIAAEKQQLLTYMNAMGLHKCTCRNNNVYVREVRQPVRVQTDDILGVVAQSYGDQAGEDIKQRAQELAKQRAQAKPVSFTLKFTKKGEGRKKKEGGAGKRQKEEVADEDDDEGDDE